MVKSVRLKPGRYGFEARGESQDISITMELWRSWCAHGPEEVESAITGILKSMKKCGICKRTDVEFSRNKAKLDGLQTRCKECDKIRGRLYYKQNPKQQKMAQERSKRRLADLQHKICEFLATHQCVDCGESNIVLLEFDHVSGDTKKDDVANMLNRGFGWEKILAEIQKCDVRCANCHRMKTAKQFGNYRLDWLSSSNVERRSEEPRVVSSSLT